MMKKFESYQLALELYHGCEGLKLPSHLRDQLLRASLSIVLNLAEGSGKPTLKDKRRFYAIALGSCRETQALLHVTRNEILFALANRVGGCLYRLVHPRP